MRFTSTTTKPIVFKFQKTLISPTRKPTSNYIIAHLWFHFLKVKFVFNH